VSPPPPSCTRRGRLCTRRGRLRTRKARLRGVGMVRGWGDGRCSGGRGAAAGGGAGAAAGAFSARRRCGARGWGADSTEAPTLRKWAGRQQRFSRRSQPRSCQRRGCRSIDRASRGSLHSSTRRLCSGVSATPKRLSRRDIVSRLASSSPLRCPSRLPHSTSRWKNGGRSSSSLISSPGGAALSRRGRRRSCR
jgi:hypothetical protein